MRCRCSAPRSGGLYTLASVGSSWRRDTGITCCVPGAANQTDLAKWQPDVGLAPLTIRGGRLRLSDGASLALGRFDALCCRRCGVVRMDWAVSVTHFPVSALSVGHVTASLTSQRSTSAVHHSLLASFRLLGIGRTEFLCGER